MTDAPFRRLAALLGAGLVVSEMTACDALVQGRQTATAAPRTRHRHSCGSARRMRSALDGRGRAHRGRRGRRDHRHQHGMPGASTSPAASPDPALMRDLDHALRLIEATIAAVGVPVTLKMRLGWDERSINAPELARRAEEAGVSLITVHGRTRCQFYNGHADWRAVRAIKDAVSIPARRQWRHSLVPGCCCGARCVRRRCGDGRAWRAGPAMVPRPDRALSRNQGARARSAAGRHSGLSCPNSMTRYSPTTAPGLGSRHARKHLGWGLDVAVAGAGASAAVLKPLRARVLTADQPREVQGLLAEAFATLAREGRRMSVAKPCSGP